MPLATVATDAVAEEPEEREVEIAFELPVELRAGVYANNVNVWSSPDEFTLDFCVAERPEPTDPDDPSSPLQMVYLGVSRIRIPSR